MSSRRNANLLAIQQSERDEGPSSVEYQAYVLEKALMCGSPRWSELVRELVNRASRHNEIDIVTDPYRGGWNPGGSDNEGVNRRLEAAMNSWRRDADGGELISIDDTGGIVWRAGWQVEDNENPTGGSWRMYTVLAEMSQDGSVDPSSVAILVYGRGAQRDHGRSEATLFIGGPELANEVSKRILEGLVVDAVRMEYGGGMQVGPGEYIPEAPNETRYRNMGGVGLKFVLGDNGDNYGYHAVENRATGTMAEVGYHRDWDSWSLYSGSRGGGLNTDIAVPILKESISNHLS